MDAKPEMIREDIDETRHSLTEKLETLEGQLRGTVESAKQTVEDTVENVKDSIHHISPVYQTTQRPFLMVGGAVATGILAGRLLQNRRGPSSPMPWIESSRTSPELYVSSDEPSTEASQATESNDYLRTSEYEDVSMARRASAAKKTGPSLLQRFADEFDDEIQMVKGMVLKGVIDAAGDLVKRSAPNWTEHIDQVLGSVKHKLTDSPSVSSRGARPVDMGRRDRTY